MKPEINVVWLKRDLRTTDHAALAAAENAGLPYLILFLFEPTLLNRPDCSERHIVFQQQSIEDMNRKLSHAGMQVHIACDEATAVFDYLIEKFSLNTVFSYQESGVFQTWERDKSIAKLFKKHKVGWQEFQRDGILRGIQNREGWDKHWFGHMHTPQESNPFTPQLSVNILLPFATTPANIPTAGKWHNGMQPGGRTRPKLPQTHIQAGREPHFMQQAIPIPCLGKYEYTPSIPKCLHFTRSQGAQACFFRIQGAPALALPFYTKV